jgi:hypothetical protein
MLFKFLASSALTLLMTQSAMAGPTQTEKASFESAIPNAHTCILPMPTPPRLEKSTKAGDTWRVEYTFTQTYKVVENTPSTTPTTAETKGVLFLTEDATATQQNVRSHTYVREVRRSDFIPFTIPPLMLTPTPMANTNNGVTNEKPGMELVPGMVNEGFSIVLWRDGDSPVLHGTVQNVELQTLTNLSAGDYTIQMPQTLEQKEEFSVNVRHAKPFSVVFEGPLGKGVLTITVGVEKTAK